MIFFRLAFCSVVPAVIKEYLDPDTRKTDISAMGFYDAFDQFVKMEGQLAQTPTKHWAYSTVKKHIVYLKWFLRLAVKMDITKNYEFEKLYLNTNS